MNYFGMASCIYSFCTMCVIYMFEDIELTGLKMDIAFVHACVCVCVCVCMCVCVCVRVKSVSA